MLSGIDGMDGVYKDTLPRAESLEEAHPTVVGSPEYRDENLTLPRWMEEGFLAGPSAANISHNPSNIAQTYSDMPHSHFPPELRHHRADLCIKPLQSCRYLVHSSLSCPCICRRNLPAQSFPSTRYLHPSKLESQLEFHDCLALVDKPAPDTMFLLLPDVNVFCGHIPTCAHSVVGRDQIWIAACIVLSKHVFNQIRFVRRAVRSNQLQA
jgi:hypothetical protein